MVLRELHAHLGEIGALGELLDGVAAVAQDARVAVDVADCALHRRRVGVPPVCAPGNIPRLSPAFEHCASGMRARMGNGCMPVRFKGPQINVL